MTIVIGIQTKDGAILVGDCQITCSDTKRRYAGKIDSALNHSEDSAKITGIYYGSAGIHLGFCDIGYLAKGVFSEEKNTANLLTDKFVLDNSVEGINKLIETKEKEIRALFGNGRNPKCSQAEKELEQIIHCRNVRAFIESSTPGTMFDLSRVVLRISDNYQPDIIHINNDSSVAQVQYKVIGSGKKFVDEERLRTGLDANTEDTLNVVVEEMNRVLTDREHYTGYQLVVVKINGEKLEIKTAEEMRANDIDLKRINWKLVER